MNLSQRASHSSILWLVKMIEVPDLDKVEVKVLQCLDESSPTFCQHKKRESKSAPSNGVDGLPHFPPRRGVHPSCWFVQQHHFWPETSIFEAHFSGNRLICPVRKIAPSNESKSDIELPLIAATVLATRPIEVLGQVDEAGELLQLLVDPVFRASEAADPRKEGQHLSAGQHLG